MSNPVVGEHAKVVGTQPRRAADLGSVTERFRQLIKEAAQSIDQASKVPKSIRERCRELLPVINS